MDQLASQLQSALDHVVSALELEEKGDVQASLECYLHVSEYFSPHQDCGR